MKYLPFSLFSAVLLLMFSINSSQAQAPRSYTSSEILLQLKKLNTVGSVLYIAAHPDDENTRLIAYLANEKCLRTGYLSLTRGDGGQNLIGPEQGVELGVIRTQELLAARRIDGGEQFFTRAYDFGYSKTPKETFQKWNHDSVLSDVVWVIRNFRPDIIITRFATDGSGGHGHHTASAILAEEAFDAAGDPKRFPEQLQYVDVWQPRRLFWNVSTRFANPNADMSPYIKLDVGGYNALLGKSYGEIAAESRSMHKSQGFGSAKQRGEYFEYLKPLKGDTTGLKDIFQGMDFSWSRIKGGDKILELMNKTIAGFNHEQTESSVSALSLILKMVRDNKSISETQKIFLVNQISECLLSCAKIFVEALSATPSVVDSISLRIITVSRGSLDLARHDNVLVFSDDFNNPLAYVELPKPVQKNVPDTIKATRAISGTTQPYWLGKQPDGLFSVSDLRLIGQPENIGPFVLCVLEVNSQTITVKRKIQYKWVEPDKGELYRSITIAPPTTISFDKDLVLFDRTLYNKINVTLKAGKENISGVLRVSSTDTLYEGRTAIIDKKDSTKVVLQLPYFSVSSNNEYVSKEKVEFSIKKNGAEQKFAFFITSPYDSRLSDIKFITDINRDESSKSMKEIKYDHIPIQTLFPEAQIKLVRLDVKKKLKRIGYIPGAGDQVAPCLTQLGYEVITITDAMMATENLNQFEAIVTGVRAYNTNEKLPQFKQKLMDYVAAGGNLIVQYNTNSWAGPLSSDIGPFKFKITRDRITDENAAVKFLLPQHPVFNYPNKITEKDFEGWIQERSIYHAGEWDSNYVAPISMADPDEKPNNGALIIAGYGKGHFVYTGLVFFRELPAGVPGAYRLFVNILELGK